VAILEIFAGAVGKGIVSLLGPAYSYVKTSILHDKAILELAERTASCIERIVPTKVDQIEDFLLSQEVNNIIKQVFATYILPTNRVDLLGKINTEFNQLLIQYPCLSEEEYNQISPILFESLIKTCIEIYDKNIEKDLPYLSKERLGNLKYSILQDQLINLENNVNFLVSQYRPTIQEYLNFEVNYRKQIIDRYQHIRPIHLDEAYKISIDSLYVAPNLMKSFDYKKVEQKEISNKEFIESINRCVVLGDPGAGKTTLAKKICFDFAKGISKSVYGLNDYTPIFIELKEYGIKLDVKGFSIIEYIELISSSLLQEPVLKGVFDYLLMNGRAFIIFDGLDELLDTNKRQIISDNIESFCNKYPAAPILVTSRKVGYEQAPLSKDRFETYYISNFNPAQVKEYVVKWFSQNTDLKEEEKEKKVTTFLRESHNVSELRSNPLILSLMCGLYRGEGFIPKNRPQVYKKCSELLFERWDKIRGINNITPFDAPMQPTLMYIAFQIYSNDKFASGVPEGELINITSKYIFPKWQSDRDIAEKIAMEFISFCRGRAWVFTEIGSSGHNLYQFTHRTFLEYFTANYLTRNYSSPKKLNNFLLPRIFKQEWDVVAQLSYQILNTNVEDAGNNLINILMTEVSRHSLPQKFYLTSFMVRCLEFLVLSPATIQKIVKNCIILSIELNQISKSDNSFIENGITIDELINPLFISDIENIPSIKQSIIEIYNEIIKSENINYASTGLKIITATPSFKQYLENKGKKNVLYKFKSDELVHEIIQNNQESIKNLSFLNWENAEISYHYNIVSIQKLIHHYGPGILFSINTVFGVHPLFFSSLLDRFFAHTVYCVKENKQNFSKILKIFIEICLFLKNSPPPWEYHPEKNANLLFSNNTEEFLETIEQNFPNIEKSENYYYFFLILAPLIEHEIFSLSQFNHTFNTNNWAKKNFYENILNLHIGFLDPINFIFRAKILGYNSEEVNDLLQATFQSDEERTFIINWINGDTQFLKPI